MNLGRGFGEPKSRFARALAGRPKVTAVVINHNGADLLWNCLFALQTQTYPLDQIIVVDNASTDASLPFLESNHPQVRILECQENFGYALGCNLGARMAEGDLVVFLHNDTVATPEWISRMVETFREWGPDTGSGDFGGSRSRKGRADPDKGKRHEPAGPSLAGVLHGQGLEVLSRRVRLHGSPTIFSPRGPLRRLFPGRGGCPGSGLGSGSGHPVVAARGAKVFHGEGEKPFRLPGWKKEYFPFRNRYLTLLTFYRGDTLFKLAPSIGGGLAVQLLRDFCFPRKDWPGWRPRLIWIFSHPGWLRRKRSEIQEKRGP